MLSSSFQGSVPTLPLRDSLHNQVSVRLFTKSAQLLIVGIPWRIIRSNKRVVSKEILDYWADRYLCAVSQDLANNLGSTRKIEQHSIMLTASPYPICMYTRLCFEHRAGHYLAQNGSGCHHRHIDLSSGVDPDCYQSPVATVLAISFDR